VANPSNNAQIQHVKCTKISHFAIWQINYDNEKILNLINTFDNLVFCTETRAIKNILYVCHLFVRARHRFKLYRISCMRCNCVPLSHPGC